MATQTREQGAGAAAKEAGLKSLKHMSQICGRSTSTLKDWYANDRRAFEVMLLGCVTIYNMSKLMGLGVVMDEEITRLKERIEENVWTF